MLLQFTTIPTNRLFNKINNSIEFTDVEITVQNFNDTNILITISPDTPERVNFERYNYCYIPTLKRYYYVSWVGLQKGLHLYNLECDYLQTFNKTIYNNFVFVCGLSISGNINVVNISECTGQWFTPKETTIIDVLNYTQPENEPLLRKSDLDHIKTEFNQNIYLNGIDNNNG